MILANDFSRQWADVREDVLAAVEQVGASGVYVLGGAVRGFESALAQFWGLRHAAGTGSGLDALEISLRILGCQSGDEVLTTPLSAFASTLAILKIGAVPVFVDTGENGQIDLNRCRDLCWRRPDIRYFLPVHLYGQALDATALRALRKEFDLKIVEDCAQSVGATFNGEATGTAGQLAATSFYPTKNLGAMGDGGAILTNDAALDAKARVLRFYGETARYHHTELGYNSRLDEVHAAILQRAFLPRLTHWVARRLAIAQAYSEGIRNAAVRHLDAPGCAWHLFPVFVHPVQRDGFAAYLKASNITAGIHYPTAIPDQPVMQRVPYELTDDCATARRVCASEVSLPIHPYLSDAEVEKVIEAINRWTPS
jgi:dTDP-3-amino-3,4,6-trideoxy-alpha-D-glucose transaminase